MPEQVVINSTEFARNGESLQGRVAVEKLDRLRGALFADEGALDYTLTGWCGEQGDLLLGCAVTGVLQLRCQRCLGALAFSVSLDVKLKLAEDGLALADLVDEDGFSQLDGADSIRAEPGLNVLALVEDEVLLGLPMVPMHLPEDCAASRKSSLSGLGEQNAFSALAALKARNLET